MLNLYFINNECIQIYLELLGYHQGKDVHVQCINVQKGDMANFKNSLECPEYTLSTGVSCYKFISCGCQIQLVSLIGVDMQDHTPVKLRLIHFTPEP